MEEEEDVNIKGQFKKRIQDYVIGSDAGKGAYAVVKKAIHRPTKLKVAIKIYDKMKLLDNVRKSAVNNEMDILKQLDHPNIIKLYEIIDTPKQVNNNKLDSYYYGIL